MTTPTTPKSTTPQPIRIRTFYRPFCSWWRYCFWSFRSFSLLDDDTARTAVPKGSDDRPVRKSGRRGCQRNRQSESLHRHAPRWKKRPRLNAPFSHCSDGAGPAVDRGGFRTQLVGRPVGLAGHCLSVDLFSRPVLLALHFWPQPRPQGPLSSSIKPFTPAVLGLGKVGQFRTTASVTTGWWLAALASLVLIVALYFHRRAYKPLRDAERAARLAGG